MRLHNEPPKKMLMPDPISIRLTKLTIKYRGLNNIPDRELKRAEKDLCVKLNRDGQRFNRYIIVENIKK